MTLEEQLAPTVPPPPATIPAPAPKACGCGAVHDVFDWLHLPLCGVMDDGVARIELRNCRCNSTLAVALCCVPGCGLRAMYKADGEREYCAGHELEWHMGEDREDFGDEFAREERRDYASAAE